MKANFVKIINIPKVARKKLWLGSQGTPVGRLRVKQVWLFVWTLFCVHIVKRQAKVCRLHHFHMQIFSGFGRVTWNQSKGGTALTNTMAVSKKAQIRTLCIGRQALLSNRVYHVPKKYSDGEYFTSTSTSWHLWEFDKGIALLRSDKIFTGHARAKNAIVYGYAISEYFKYDGI